jgi:hypothetical protein
LLTANLVYQDEATINNKFIADQWPELVESAMLLKNFKTVLAHGQDVLAVTENPLHVRFRCDETFAGVKQLLSLAEGTDSNFITSLTSAALSVDEGLLLSEFLANLTNLAYKLALVHKFAMDELKKLQVKDELPSVLPLDWSGMSLMTDVFLAFEESVKVSVKFMQGQRAQDLQDKVKDLEPPLPVCKQWCTALTAYAKQMKDILRQKILTFVSSIADDCSSQCPPWRPWLDGEQIKMRSHVRAKMVNSQQRISLPRHNRALFSALRDAGINFRKLGIAYAEDDTMKAALEALELSAETASVMAALTVIFGPQDEEQTPKSAAGIYGNKAKFQALPKCVQTELIKIIDDAKDRKPKRAKADKGPEKQGEKRQADQTPCSQEPSASSSAAPQVKQRRRLVVNIE